MFDKAFVLLLRFANNTQPNDSTTSFNGIANSHLVTVVKFSTIQNQLRLFQWINCQLQGRQQKALGISQNKTIIYIHTHI